MDELAAQVLCAIASHQMLKNGDTVIVACSGGADSVTLLHFLFCHAERLGVTLRAAHVNHGLRGTASDNDEAMVVSLCERLSIALDVLRLAPDGPRSEDWCRQQRYAFFNALSRQQGDAKIATAHTQNDHAETLLLHLARGAGLQGACGIPPVRDEIIRPLLTVTRAQVEAYAAQNALSFCTDATNNSDNYARNRVRSMALPALESVNPQACAALARFAEHAAQAADFLSGEAQALLQKAQWNNCIGETGYRAKCLAQAHPAVRRAALHSLLKPYADVTQARLALADEAVCRASGAVQLSAHAVLTASQGIVRVVPAAPLCAGEEPQWERPFLYPINGTNPQIVVLPGSFPVHITVKSYEKTVNFEKPSQKHLKSAADYGKIISNATFRAGRAGDTFAPAQGNGTKTLKKLYSEAKLSTYARQTNPVLTSGTTVLWAAGFGFARGLAPDDKTKQCLTIEINRGFLPHNNAGGNSDEQTHG